jgi:prepilin-type processing-associated H-X9-DG protein/prepilin-type N-terminal cleavage/methylation domain-containing protein
MGRRSAFTLIELLTSIAIIAILAALILAAVSKAKSRARSVACMSNLRESGQLLAAYALENNAYPFEGKATPELSADGQFGDWAVSLYKNAFTGMQPVKNGPWRGVLHCPSVLGRPADFPPANRYYEYGYNTRGISRKSYGDLNGLGRMKAGTNLVPVKADLVLAPSDMIALGDGIRGFNMGLWDGSPQLGRRVFPFVNSNATARARLRHNNRANIVFCDGHTEAVRLDTLFVSKKPDDLKRWNRDNQPHADIAP